jgi:hypothetical protein
VVEQHRGDDHRLVNLSLSSMSVLAGTPTDLPDPGASVHSMIGGRPAEALCGVREHLAQLCNAALTLFTRDWPGPIITA